MKYRRGNGFLVRKSGGYTILQKIGTSRKIVLHPTSAIVYSLIDGDATVQDIVDMMRNNFVNSESIEEEAILEDLDNLLLQGIIENSDGKKSHPFVTIGYQGFWDNFDPFDNFLLRSISEYFIPILANRRCEIPQIEFVNDTKLYEYNHKAKASISIGVYTRSETNTQLSFDYSISTFIEGDSVDSTYLPIWVFHMDWSDYQRENSLLSAHFDRMEKFSPKSLSDRIVSFLSDYDKDDVAQLTDGESEALTNFARITDYRSIQKGKLTIGMATFDDYDGVYFTLQSLRLHHPEVRDRLEFIVIHNNPHGPVAKALKSLEDWIPELRYLPFDEYNGTTVRDLFFREANTEYVMSIDSHVLLAPNSLKRLIDYLDENKESMDLFHGPMLYDDVKYSNYSTSFRPEWSGGMYGVWQKDSNASKETDPPFEILMQGLGLFVSRKIAWPGFNSRMRGFGAEEGYIHQKYKNLGRSTICLPFLKWVHRFQRPNGIKYPNLWDDRIRNYCITHNELGWDLTPLLVHFKNLIGAETFDPIWSKIADDLSNPMYFFDAVYIPFPKLKSEKTESIKRHLIELGWERLTRWHLIDENDAFDKIEVSNSIVDKSLRYGFKNVLILNDVLKLDKNFETLFSEIVSQIKGQEWRSISFIMSETDTIVYKVHKDLYVPESVKSKCVAIAFNLEYSYQLSHKIYLNQTSKS